MAERKCCYCGNLIPNNAIFCPSCGKKQNCYKQYCIHCGKLIEYYSDLSPIICPYCGKNNEVILPKNTGTNQLNNPYNQQTNNVISRWRCSHCGTENHQNNLYCSLCGTSKDGNTWRCHACGKITYSMYSTCYSCGKARVSTTQEFSNLNQITQTRNYVQNIPPWDNSNDIGYVTEKNSEQHIEIDASSSDSGNKLKQEQKKPSYWFIIGVFCTINVGTFQSKNQYDFSGRLFNSLLWLIITSLLFSFLRKKNRAFVANLLAILIGTFLTFVAIFVAIITIG